MRSFLHKRFKLASFFYSLKQRIEEFQNEAIHLINTWLQEVITFNRFKDIGRKFQSIYLLPLLFLNSILTTRKILVATQTTTKTVNWPLCICSPLVYVLYTPFTVINSGNSNSKINERNNLIMKLYSKLSHSIISCQIVIHKRPIKHQSAVI